MATKKYQSIGPGEYSLLGLAAFVLVAALFFFVSAKAGTRGLGASLIAGALLQQVSGRIEYGWEGRPPSGYITGWPATLFNITFGLAGLAMIVWPETVVGILGWDTQ